MSSSIEEQFQPPEWATKDEVIKAAQHYINYWKIEARHRNQQWLDALSDNARLKAEVERLELEVFAFDRTIKQASCHYDNRLEDIRQLQAQVKRLTKAGDAMAEIFKNQMDNEPECVGYLQEQLFNRWNAAKEGKQP